MVSWGVVADIHGNGEALDRALGELGRLGVDGLVCLGDLVGYNAESDAVVARLERAGAVAISGNHDLIALGSLGTERCWYQAAYALMRTRAVLGAEARRYLSALPGHVQLDERTLVVHGDLDDPQRYLRTPADVVASAARIRMRFPGVRVVLHGHTHERRVYRVRGESAERVELADSMSLAAADGEILYVNPGSIDAQRKPEGRRRAELAVLHLGAPRIDFLTVAYDDRAVERRARAEGYRMSAAGKLAHETWRALSRVQRLL